MESDAQGIFDLMFTKKMRAEAGLTDTEAKFLYDMWKSSPEGATKFAIRPADLGRREVNALKTKGYIAGFGSGIELTERGKKVIVEMVTHEPNSFEKQAKEVSYSGIKNKSASRPRQAFLSKKASKKAGKAFNLRKQSLRKLRGQ